MGTLLALVEMLVELQPVLTEENMSCYLLKIPTMKGDFFVNFQKLNSTEMAKKIFKKSL